MIDTSAQGSPEPYDPHAQQPDRDLVAFLERDQLVADTSIPLSPARLSARSRRWMWALRILTLTIGAMVVYTFAQQL